MIDQYKKIVEQAHLWEIYARIVPTAGIIMFVVLWLFVDNLTTTLIHAGVALFAITLTVWWFWAIQSIAKLAKNSYTLQLRAEEICNELKETKATLSEIKQVVKVK